MTVAVEAIFEKGVLKPLAPLELAERQRVKLTVETSSGDLKTGAPEWHWREAQAIEDGYNGAVAEEIVRQRQEN